jgi:hypothetical protein
MNGVRPGGWTAAGRLVLTLTLLVVATAFPRGAAQSQIEPPKLTLDTPYAPAGYQRLLRDYVVRVPLGGGGFETRFDYARLRKDPEQERVRHELRERFLSAAPRTMDAATRLAWALNAYNFLVIDLVIENLVTPQGEALASIADIGEGDFSIFDQERFEIGGTPYSLNRFEGHFLFRDVDRNSEDVPRDLDPRFHFALVCAARGCPPLWPEPFCPERLAAQLDRATANALLSPRQLRVQGRSVHVSKIFEWYVADFGTEEDALRFLRRYAADRIPAKRARIVPDISWDWSLNRPD